jgi:hypothetical protein
MRILNGSKLGDKKIRVNWSLSVANKQSGWLILMYCILMDHKFIIKLALSYQLYHTICSNASNQQLLTMSRFADFRTKEADSDCNSNNRRVSTWLFLIKVVTCMDV